MSELRTVTMQLEFDGTKGLSGIKQFTKAVTDADTVVEELSKTMGDNVKVTYQVVESEAEYVRQARNQVAQIERNNAKIREMTRLYEHQAAMVDKTADEQEQLNAVYRLGTSATEAQKAQVTALVQQQQALRVSTDQTGGSMRNLRGVSQQLGWQLQDVAVQAQLGTSAFVIFSQQGSQLAAAFGPTGALVGAIIAVAGAIGGALINSMSVAGEEIDSLIEKVDDLTNAQRDLVRLELGKQMDEAAKEAAGLKEQIDRMAIAQAEFGDQISDTVGKKAQENLVTLRGKYDGIIQSQGDLQKKLDDVNLSYKSNVKNVKEAKEAAEGLIKEYTNQRMEVGKNSREVDLLRAKQELGVGATDDQRKAVEEAVNATHDAIDAEEARITSVKNLEDAQKKAATTEAQITKARESAFRAEYMSLTKATETIEQEYERRKDIIDDFVQHTGTDKRTDEAYAALEQWKTQKLTEEFQKRENVRRTIEKAQLKQARKEDPMGPENDLYAQNLATLNEQKAAAGEAGLIEQQRINALIEGEETRHTDAMADINTGLLVSQLEMYGKFTGTLGDIFGRMQQFAEEGSSAAAALFYVNQAIAIAQAIIATEQAAAQALTLGPIFGIPAASVVRGLGYASVGIIAGQTIAGAYDKGGTIPSGQLGIVSEYGDELVNGQLIQGPARVTSREDTAKMMGGSQTNIVIENRVEGTTYRTEQMDKDTVKIIAEQVFNQNIDPGVASVMGNRNSKTTKQMKSKFNVRGSY